MSSNLHNNYLMLTLIVNTTRNDVRENIIISTSMPYPGDVCCTLDASILNIQNIKDSGHNIGGIYF